MYGAPELNPFLAAYPPQTQVAYPAQAPYPYVPQQAAPYPPYLQKPLTIFIFLPYFQLRLKEDCANTYELIFAIAKVNPICNVIFNQSNQILV